MGQSIHYRRRLEVITLRESGYSLRGISQEMGLSYQTVQSLCARYLIEGEAGLKPRYGSCGRPARLRSDLIYRAACWLKYLHRDWGAVYINCLLRARYPQSPRVSVRTLQRWFRASHLTPPRIARAQSEVVVPSADQVHRIWEVDAKEQLVLNDGTHGCYLTVVDQCSGSLLAALVFPL